MTLFASRNAAINVPTRANESTQIRMILKMDSNFGRIKLELQDSSPCAGTVPSRVKLTGKFVSVSKMSVLVTLASVKSGENAISIFLLEFGSSTNGAQSSTLNP